MYNQNLYDKAGKMKNLLGIMMGFSNFAAKW